MLASLEIPLPPLPEQRRIAAILDKADALRRQRKRAIDLLDSLTQSIFVEMFGETRSDVKVAEICTRVTDGTHQSPKWSTNGVPFLFVSNIRNQKIKYESDKFVSRDEYRNLTKSAPIAEGDVLYTAVGSYGNAAVVDGSKEFVFQRHIAHLKPRRDRVLSAFLSYALESSSVRRQADMMARGVAQKTVTLDSLKNFSIPLPPLEAQRQFENAANAVRSHAEGAYASLTAQTSLFASLQSRAFSGQL